MKKLIAGSMAVLLAAPAFAGGQMYEQQTTNFLGWDILPYVAVRGGATYGNLNYKVDGTKESVAQNLYQARVALGLSMYETARLEIEGSFFTKGKTYETEQCNRKRQGLPGDRVRFHKYKGGAYRGE